MEKLKIERLFKGKKETKFGEKDTVAIKVSSPKYADKWISTFKTKGTENWKEGDEVEITVSEKNGFYNFDVGDVLTLESLDARIKKLEARSINEPEIDIIDNSDF